MRTCQLCPNPAAEFYARELGEWKRAPSYVPAGEAGHRVGWILLELCSGHWESYNAASPEKRLAMGSLIAARLSKEEEGEPARSG